MIYFTGHLLTMWPISRKDIIHLHLTSRFSLYLALSLVIFSIYFVLFFIYIKLDPLRLDGVTLSHRPSACVCTAKANEKEREKNEWIIHQMKERESGGGAVWTYNSFGFIWCRICSIGNLLCFSSSWALGTHSEHRTRDSIPKIHRNL